MEIFKRIIALFRKISRIFQKKELYIGDLSREQRSEPSTAVESIIDKEEARGELEKEIEGESIGELEERVEQSIPEGRRRKKPQKKRAPTEQDIKTRRTVYKEQRVDHAIGKEVKLGKKRSTGRAKRPKSLEAVPKERREEKSAQSSIRVRAPFVEIDLDRAKVFLVIPKQSLTVENSSKKQLSYRVSLDNEVERPLPVGITGNEEYPETEEERIEIEKPIKNFKIAYPEELGGRNYTYEHRDDSIYTFIAVGDGLGRMHYLYEGGNINPLPQREIWVLLEEDFEPEIEPILEEDRWIWEKYRPLYIDLRDKSELVIINRKLNKREAIPCKSTFSIEGEEIIYDDFSDQSPIFTGNSIKIKAPTINEEGWVVYVQNKQDGYKIVSDNWLGKDPLELRFDRDLPCECGEFQVDICGQDGKSVNTLFFRYIPSLRLDYSRELIIPDPKKGHKTERVEISLPYAEYFEIETEEQIKPTPKGYEIILPPKRDVFRFSIFKKNKPETKVSFRVTVPRLKWKTSRHIDWRDTPLRLEREELLTSEELYLYINTNSFPNYNISAILEANNQKLQESKFVRKRNIYSILLNQFYDTIKESKGRIVLKIKILKNERIIGENIPVLYLSEKITLRPIPRGSRKSMRPIVRCGTGMREGRGFSKEEIIQAGIRIEDAKRLNIPYDKHRKSAHPKNIEILRSLVGGDNYADRSD
jgi:hypothetical protein